MMKTDDWKDIFEAVSTANLAAVERMLAEDDRLISARGLMGMTLLHMAAIRLQQSIARLLIEKGADVNARKDDGWIPLHNASQNGDAALVALLLDYGADPNARSNDGATPLHVASHGISETTINQLKLERQVAHLDPPVIDHDAVVRLLLAKGADVNVRKTNDGATPLILAVNRGHEGVVQTLLENGADAKAASFAGWTPLHIAAAKCNEQLVRLLVENGADVETSGKEGRKPREVIGMAAETIDSTAKTNIAEILCSSTTPFSSSCNVIEDKRTQPEKGDTTTEQNDIREIVLEANSLEEARQLLESKIPEGFYKVSEDVISDGTPKTRVATGESIASAFREAECAMPSGVEIQERRKIQTPGKRSLEVKGFDEQKADSLVKQKLSQYEKVEMLQLKKRGRWGFLGIGRAPDLYAVTILQPAVVEIVYREPAKIRAKLRQLPSKATLMNSLNELEKQTAEQWLRLDQPIKGEVVALWVMIAAFQFLKEKVSNPFNLILADAKVLFAKDRGIQGLAALHLGPPERNFDVSDIPLVSQQFKEALTWIKQLKEYLEGGMT